MMEGSTLDRTYALAYNKQYNSARHPLIQIDGKWVRINFDQRDIVIEFETKEDEAPEVESEPREQ